MFNKKEAIYLYIVNCLFYLIPISILLILPSLALKKIRTCILTGFCVTLLFRIRSSKKKRLPNFSNQAPPFTKIFAKKDLFDHYIIFSISSNSGPIFKL